MRKSDSSGYEVTGARTAAEPAGVRPAVFVLGLVLVGAIAVWIAWSEIPGKVFISSWCLVIPAVMVLVLLVALAGWRRLQLKRAEILLVYLMISATSGFVGYAMLHMLLPTLGTAAFYANDSNHYGELLHVLPQFIKPARKALLRPLFMGDSTPDWPAWGPTAAFWLSFMLVAFLLMLSLDLLVWRRWVRLEKLTFPLAQIPLELTSAHRNWLKSRTLWAGAAIPIVLQTLLAFHYWYPAVPALPLKHEDFAQQLFHTRPWTAMGRFFLRGSPFFFGLAYLAPTDISFSMWFFAWVRFVVLIVSNLAGLDAPFGRNAYRFPFINEQNVGSYVAFGLAALWLVQGDVKRVLRGAWKRERLDEDERLMLVGVLGAVVCTAGLVVFGWLLGMRWWLTLVVFGLFYLFGITLARARAEAGPPWVFGCKAPFSIVTRTLGTAHLDKRDLVGLGSLIWFMGDIRSIPMPAQLEAFKLAESGNLRRKVVVWGLVAATVVALIAGFAGTLSASYYFGLGSAKVYGGPRWMGFYSANATVQWIRDHSYPDWSEALLSLPGVAITWSLMLLRSHFTWWPLNPLGYVLSNNPTGEVFWFAYFCAWLVKSLIVRYGGIRLYRKTLPFALGVVLGDMLIQGFWSAFASIFNLPVYQFIS